MATPIPEGDSASPSFRDLLGQFDRLRPGEWLSFARADQRKRWLRRERALVETYLEHCPVLANDPEATLDLIYSEVLLREEMGEEVTIHEYLDRFPHLNASLQRQFALHRALESDSLLSLGQLGETSRPSLPPWEPPTSDPDLRQELHNARTNVHSASEPSGSQASTTPQGPQEARRRGHLPEVPGYALTRELGRGGMGVVYQGRQLRPPRPVAVKMILSGELADAGERDRFMRETTMVASLRHPNIVAIYEVGEADGKPFCSLEFVDGGSLAARLDGIPWAAEPAACLIETLARAIHHAHERGIVHRDLKPANVLMTSDSEPKITDFGLAKKLDDASGPTRSGDIMGTPSYMAPEQASGKSKSIGPAADVYALGCLLYELLTGRPPFRAATSVDTILQVISSEPVPASRLNPRVPRDLETIDAKCLHKDPARRYASASHLADDLRRFLNGEPIVARPVSSLERGWKFARRHRAASLITLALFLAIVVFSVAGWVLRNQEANARSEAQDNLYVTQITAADREWSATRDVGRARAILEQCDPERRRWEWYYLHHLCRGGLHVLPAPEGKLVQAMLTSNGRAAIVATENGGVLVREMATGKERARWQAPPSLLKVLSVGGFVITVSRERDEKARIASWDPATGAQVASLLTEADRVLAVEGTGRILVLKSGLPVRSLNARLSGEPLPAMSTEWPVLGAALSHHGDLVATAGGDVEGPGALLAVEAAVPNKFEGISTRSRPGELKVWDSRTGTILHSLKGHASTIADVAFCLDDTRLASAGWDRKVNVWRVQDGQLLHSLVGHREGVRRVRFGATPDHLVSEDLGGQVKLWNLREGKELFSGEAVAGTVPRTAFAADGRWLALANVHGDLHGEIVLWDLPAGREVRRFRGHTAPIVSLSFSSQGSLLLSASEDRTVRLWDVTLDQVARVVPSTDAFALAPDGDQIAIGNDEGAIHLMSLATWTTRHILTGHTAGLQAMAFSPEGRHLVSSARDFDAAGEVIVWDTTTGKKTYLVPDQPGVSQLTYTADGRWIVLADTDHSLTLISSDTGRRVDRLAGHQDRIRALTSIPGSDRFLSASWDGTIRTWSAATSGSVRKFQGPTAGIGALAMSGDGKNLAVVDKRGTSLLLLEGESGAVRWEAPTPVACTSVALTTDAQRVALGGEDGTIHLWDARRGQPLLVLRGARRAAIRSLAFSRDDRYLVSLAGEALEVWDASRD